jgi:hypothetical protein
MTQETPCREGEPSTAELLIEPGFVATELAFAMDALRIANRLSGLNLIGANQHFAVAVWGLFLIAVMILRSERASRALFLPFLRGGR